MTNAHVFPSSEKAKAWVEKKNKNARLYKWVLHDYMGHKDVLAVRRKKQMVKDWLATYRKFNGENYKLQDTNYDKSKLQKLPKYATSYRIIKKGRVYCLYTRQEENEIGRAHV